MKKIVMKFGGTSVANGKKIRHVANLIADNRNEDCEVVVVVSALEGVTNQLIQAAEEAKKETTNIFSSLSRKWFLKSQDMRGGVKVLEAS